MSGSVHLPDKNIQRLHAGGAERKTGAGRRVSDAVIEVMDSQLVTALQGMFVKEAVKLRNQGKSLEEAVEALAPIRSTGHIFFTTKDLKYLEHGEESEKQRPLREAF